MFTKHTPTIFRHLFSAALLVLFANITFAQQIVRDDATQMLKQTTDILLTSAKNSKSNSDKDKQRYYNEVEVVLNQVIDKEYFARGVMATYASARQYNALKTDAEREAFRNRVSKFSDVMQIALIEKYADVLLLFDGGKIEYENLKQDTPDGSKVNLKQLVHNKNGETYIIQYNLHKDKQGKWLVYNFIVEGVNLGSTYRNQFAEAIEKNKNNVDYVVANWASILSQGARE
jgi:phospholipid transport system substrate-binding protein